MTFLRVSTIIFSFAVLNLSCFAQRPDLSTLEGRVQWLFWAQQQMPRLFLDSALYSTDLLALLERYHTFVSEHPRSSRPYPFVRMEIENPRIRSVERRVTSSLFDAWRNRLHQSLSEDSSETSFGRDQLISDIQRLHSQNNRATSFSIIQSLIRFLPESQRSRFSHRFTADQIQILQEHLPENFASRGWIPTVVGLPPNTGKQQLLTTLQTLHKLEARVLTELMLYLREDLNAPPVQPTIAEVSSLLSELNESYLDLFADKAARRGHLSALRGLNENQLAVANRLIDHFLQWSEFREYTELVTSEINETIIIQEIGELGILRGYQGHDCSTQRSALYAMAQGERVFFIKVRNQDGSERDLGYVATSRVLEESEQGELITTESDHEGLLYLHSVNGTHLSGTHTKLILRAFQLALPKLRTRALVFPTEEKLVAFINTTGPRNQFIAAVRRSRRIKIQYVDTEDRALIDTTSSQSYDRASENTHGHLIERELHVAGLNESKIHIYDDETALAPYAQILTPEPWAILELVLVGSREFHLDQSHPSLRDIFQAYPLPGWQQNPRFEHLLDLINNRSRSSVNDFRTALETYMGIPENSLSETNFQKLYSLILSGFLRSPDALSEAHRDLTIETILKRLRANPGQEYSYLADFIRHHQAIFAHHQNFRDYAQRVSRRELFMILKSSLNTVFTVFPPEFWVRARAESLEFIEHLINRRGSGATDYTDEERSEAQQLLIAFPRLLSQHHLQQLFSEARGLLEFSPFFGTRDGSAGRQEVIRFAQDTTYRHYSSEFINRFQFVISEQRHSTEIRNMSLLGIQIPVPENFKQILLDRLYAYSIPELTSHQRLRTNLNSSFNFDLKSLRFKNLDEALNEELRRNAIAPSSVIEILSHGSRTETPWLEIFFRAMTLDQNSNLETNIEATTLFLRTYSLLESKGYTVHFDPELMNLALEKIRAKLDQFLDSSAPILILGQSYNILALLEDLSRSPPPHLRGAAREFFQQFLGLYRSSFETYLSQHVKSSPATIMALQLEDSLLRIKDHQDRFCSSQLTTPGL